MKLPYKRVTPMGHKLQKAKQMEFEDVLLGLHPTRPRVPGPPRLLLMIFSKILVR